MTTNTPVAIDIHAHCTPPGVLSYAGSTNRLGIGLDVTPSGPVVTMPDGTRSLPISHDSTDASARLAAMEETMVTAQVLSPMMDVVGYRLGVQAASAWARIQNESMVEFANEFRPAMDTLATVPLQDGKAAVAELDHAVRGLGMVGVEVGSRIGDRQLDDPDLEQFWEAAAALRCIVLLHPVDPLPGLDLSELGLVHLVGRPAETTIAAARLILSGVVERHEGLTIVAVHGGGFLPYQIGRVGKYEMLRHLKPSTLSMTPREAMATLYFDTVLSDSRSLEALVQMVGAERVLLGSDFPFAIGDLDPVRSVEAVPGFSDEERALILRSNYELLRSRIRS